MWILVLFVVAGSFRDSGAAMTSINMKSRTACVAAETAVSNSLNRGVAYCINPNTGEVLYSVAKNANQH